MSQKILVTPLNLSFNGGRGALRLGSLGTPGSMWTLGSAIRITVRAGASTAGAAAQSYSGTMGGGGPAAVTAGRATTMAARSHLGPR